MTQTPPLKTLALLAAALAATPPLVGDAQAQAAVRLDGTCETLVIAGQDATAACKGILDNAAERGRTTFGFSTSDGRTLSFSGNGARQDRTEDTDPLQPINLVTPGTISDKGVVRMPTMAIGACRFTAPAPGMTAIACEANAPDGRVFAGTFVTQAKAAPGAPAQ